MKNAPSFTLKIVNDSDMLESFNQQRPLSEIQKELIRLVVRETVQEVLREQPQVEPGLDRILRLPELVRITGMCRSSVYRYVSEGNFPKPIKLGIRSVGWRESQINKWLEVKSSPELASYSCI